MDSHPSDWSEGTQISLVTGISLAVAGRNACVDSFFSVFNIKCATAALWFLVRVSAARVKTRLDGALTTLV